MSNSWNATERARLAQALALAGPGAPTLCEGWSAAHLATHLVLREHKPWAVFGAPFERAVAGATERPAFDALVTSFARTPAAWSPARWAGEQMNLLEYHVHLQDVVRAGPQDGAARAVPEQALERALWAQLRYFARLLYRPAPVGVVLAVTDGPRTVVRKPRSGSGSVVISGQASELALHAFGRGAVADVTVEGLPEDVAALAVRFPAPAPRG
ncbi:TIGR03085 family metal-binding protein [Sanguibacter antarcticus]|nr:TIGR03085 family metal-binding protein [Sanguibacter antarcticus]